MAARVPSTPGLGTGWIELRLNPSSACQSCFRPAALTHGVIDRLYQDTVRAQRSADVSEKLARLGAEPMDHPPEPFSAYIRDEIASNAALVNAAGIKAQ